MATPYTTTPRPATVSVTQAARLLGVGRTLAYELARWQNELAPGVPIVRVGGRRYRVPTKALAAALGLTEEEIWARLEVER
ncbi:helix-turn-helix domain-containing protein [Thermorudis peleae]|uniref:helix-turn-helix domain-containing protein n=1 Tax=Thermorudis peleae TaxID=1382356 RepID=UPI00056F7375|nr:helix-turn-helix domain-containing protein [Thermorudis peleae]